MKLEYYDQNMNGAFSPFIYDAEENNQIKLETIKSFDEVGLSSPDSVVVHPCAVPGGDYWKELHSCVNSKPDLKFYIISLSDYTRKEICKYNIDSLRNVEIWDSFSVVGRFRSILEEVISD